MWSRMCLLPSRTSLEDAATLHQEEKTETTVHSQSSGTKICDVGTKYSYGHKISCRGGWERKNGAAAQSFPFPCPSLRRKSLFTSRLCARLTEPVGETQAAREEKPFLCLSGDMLKELNVTFVVQRGAGSYFHSPAYRLSRSVNHLVVGKSDIKFLQLSHGSSPLRYSAALRLLAPRGSDASALTCCRQPPPAVILLL